MFVVYGEKSPQLSSFKDAYKDELSETVNELAISYAGYLNLDFSKEKQFNETTEDLLTKLDEYIGFADLIRSDVNLALLTTLPSIQVKSHEMEKHFDRIDRLEAFMLTVKKNVAELECLVDKAESDMGRLSSLKKVINSISLPSLFTPKSQLPRSPPPKVVPKFDPVPIFRTDDYFRYHSSSVTPTTRTQAGLVALDVNVSDADSSDVASGAGGRPTVVCTTPDEMTSIALGDTSNEADNDSELTISVCDESIGVVDEEPAKSPPLPLHSDVDDGDLKPSES